MDTDRLRELLRQPAADGVSARAKLEALRPLVEELLEAYEAERAREGGTFGRGLLEALEGRVLQQLNERMELSDRVSLLSCGVHVTPQFCLVDARLKVDAL